jgi:type I restriction enzyme M protein
MDSSSLQNLLKRLCKVMWNANVTDPITYVTQISYLLFLKMLEEMDAERGGQGSGNHSIFDFVKIDGEKIDFSKLRWSVLTSDPDNERMLRNLRDLLPKLALHPALSPGARAIFDDARIVIPDGATLRLAADLISPVNLLAEDADVKGDLFEMLSSDLGQQKRSAQYRTPRHLIRVIVEMVDPQIGRTICDAACGTGGFLIAAYEHIILANTSPEFVREVIAPSGFPVKRGVGDRLSPSQWKFLQSAALHGFDGEPVFVRMTSMNALLHGFDYSPIIRRDSICGSEDKWDEVQFDYILENPPFSGQRGDAKRSLRIEKGDKYVLFLAHALRSLRPGGRAGIIFPNGILFGDTGSHLEVKKRLLTECDLQAVVTLPKGMFEPYTPNPTCFLIFEKTGKPTKETWFYRVEGDGSSLKKARKFGLQYRNDLPDLLAKWPTRAVEDGKAWRVPAEQIIANGYNMSLTSLGLIEPDKVEHGQPQDILESVAEKERRILEIIGEIKELSRLWRQEYEQMLDIASMRALGRCGRVVGGGTPSKKNPAYWGGKIPWVTAKDMWDYEVTDSELKITESAFKASPVKLIPPDSVLFVVRGSILFKRVPVAINRVECTINQDMKAIVPDEAILGDYLAHMMCAANEKLKALVDVAGNSAGKLETEKWSAVEIPIPKTTEEQRLVITRLDALAMKQAELIRLRTETETQLTSLNSALLANDFRNDL